MSYNTFNQPTSGDGTVPYTVYSGCDLRRLAKSISENVEVYLLSLERSNIPPPTFHPNSSTASTTGKVGQDAQRALVDASERIVALTTGPLGLYNLSRQYLQNAALTVATELNIANIIPIDGHMHADDIAAETGADSSVIVRIMRALTPIFIFDEVSPKVYRHTARSASMQQEIVKALLLFGGIEGAKAAACLPEVLRAQSYQPPTEPHETAFSLAFSDGKVGFFDYLYNGQHDDAGLRFTKAMIASTSFSYETGNVADIFPFDILGDKVGPGTIVDIGGGEGHIMITIAVRYPEANLRFVIQDLQANVDIGKTSLPAKLQPKFEWMVHDFFSANQPIQHAEAYFLRHILHDWPDKYCQKILKPIAKAMKPGYSRLLVSDMVVPEMTRVKAVALRDLLMMVHCAGMERTEQQFAALFRSVDPNLRIVKIWQLPTSAPGGFRIIEVVLDSEQ